MYCVYLFIIDDILYDIEAALDLALQLIGRYASYLLKAQHAVHRLHLLHYSALSASKRRVAAAGRIH